MLSDDELAEARALLYDDEGVGDLGARLTSEWAAIRYNAAVNVSGRKLLAEIERLQAENAALREVAQVFSDYESEMVGEDDFACQFCSAELTPWRDRVVHQADCPVLKARALLAREANEPMEGTGE